MQALPYRCRKQYDDELYSLHAVRNKMQEKKAKEIVFVEKQRLLYIFEYYNMHIFYVHFVNGTISRAYFPT